VKVIIRSTLGGNLRLRVPNTLTSEKGQALIKAAGKNENEFYYLEQVSSPIISPEANLATPAIKETLVYDIPTQPGNEYTFVASKK
jgi:alpha-L-fucosidase 2